MQNRTSRSAEHVALFRALETARHRDRLFDDPYAVRFLPLSYRLVARLARVPAIGRRVERYIDTRWPGGPRASAVARTRLIDELVSDALAHGVRQVVLLGAGYDSRAYRLAAMASARVFEVDHPATQATKQRLVRSRVPGALAAGVSFVPVDLGHDDLAATLTAARFAAGEPTVVVWEGVTNYLTAEAVDSTLRQLARLTHAGSRIVFTYVNQAALDRTSEFKGVEGWRAALEASGEPWTFGFHPAQLPAYLDQRGLRLTVDMSTSDAADTFLRPLGRHEPTAEFYRVAQAEVR